MIQDACGTEMRNEEFADEELVVNWSRGYLYRRTFPFFTAQLRSRPVTVEISLHIIILPSPRWGRRDSLEVASSSELTLT